MAPSRGASGASQSAALSPISSRFSGESNQIPAADPIIPAASVRLDLSHQSDLRCPHGSEKYNEKATDNDTSQADDSWDSSERVTAHADIALPPGCCWGPVIDSEPMSKMVLKLEPEALEAEKNYRLIWVDFPPASPQNPFFFTNGRKILITIVATVFTIWTSINVGAYSITTESMKRDLGLSTLESSVGLGIYNFGFAITPLVLAPLSEEFGRRWTYVIAVVIYLLMHIMMALAKNLPTMLMARLLQGCSGSVGATLVGGTIADIFVPAQRGLPSALFAFCAVAGSGIGPIVLSWVESNPRLEWRWVWWIQTMMIAALIPPIFIFMRETRETIILRRRAKRFRKERGLADGGRYTARSEEGKTSLWAAMRTSTVRPITFLIFEPILTFFSLWMSIGWGVLYTMITGLRYIFSNVYQFNVNQVGLVYISLVLGAAIGFGLNFLQDSIYRRKVEKRGIEARLYAPMVAGLTLAGGCFIFGLTSLPSVHWIVPCIGIVIIIASILTIYISAFVYISECYGSYASSAIAAQSFLRNAFGGAFCFFTLDMYDALTPRWTTFLWGCVALVLAAVPFIAFHYGPKIRARSKYSKILMREEQERILREKEVLDGLG